MTGPVLVDHPQLGDLGVQLALAHPVVDRLQLAQHGGDAATLVPVEVGADSGAQVLCLADVYHRPVPVAEEVDAGEPGEAVAEPDLAVVRGTPGGGELQQVLEHGHPDGPGPLQERIEDVERGGGVLECAVDRGDRGSHVSGERRQPQVGNLLSPQPAGQRRGVNRTIGRRRVSEGERCGTDEGEVEPDVVTDHHGVSDELEERGKGGLDRRRPYHHGVGDPGEDRDERRDRRPRVDERLERAEHLAPANFHRTDLGDPAIDGRPARRLQVEHAERYVEERCAEVVKAGLNGERHPAEPTSNICSGSRIKVVGGRW